MPFALSQDDEYTVACAAQGYLCIESELHRVSPFRVGGKEWFSNHNTNVIPCILGICGFRTITEYNEGDRANNTQERGIGQKGLGRGYWVPVNWTRYCLKAA